jgi:hypothetical protein
LTEDFSHPDGVFAPKFRISIQPRQSFAACLGQHSRVARQIGKTKIRETGLARAEQLARTAQPKVGFGDFKTVMFFFHYAQALSRYRVSGAAID